MLKQLYNISLPIIKDILYNIYIISDKTIPVKYIPKVVLFQKLYLIILLIIQNIIEKLKLDIKRIP